MRMIIIGCGRMGAGLAGLLGASGHEVTVVDRDGGAMSRLDPSCQGRTIVGSGFDREVLLAAGIERADGLAAVTDSDDANVVVARLARQVFRVPITRSHTKAMLTAPPQILPSAMAITGTGTLCIARITFCRGLS